MTKEELALKAQQMCDAAYAPYSHFHVGAALLCKDGTVYTGCNVENASYGAVCCAERTAFFKAVSEGHKEFSAIAVAAVQDGQLQPYTTPCGICRQVMAEFCDPDTFMIYLVGPHGVKGYTLHQMLPMSFTSEDL